MATEDKHTIVCIYAGHDNNQQVLPTLIKSPVKPPATSALNPAFRVYFQDTTLSTDEISDNPAESIERLGYTNHPGRTFYMSTVSKTHAIPASWEIVFTLLTTAHPELREYVEAYRDKCTRNEPMSPKVNKSYQVGPHIMSPQHFLSYTDRSYDDFKQMLAQWYCVFPKFPLTKECSWYIVTKDDYDKCSVSLLDTKSLSASQILEDTRNKNLRTREQIRLQRDQQESEAERQKMEQQQEKTNYILKQVARREEALLIRKAAVQQHHEQLNQQRRQLPPVRIASPTKTQRPVSLPPPQTTTSITSLPVTNKVIENTPQKIRFDETPKPKLSPLAPSPVVVSPVLSSPTPTTNPPPVLPLKFVLPEVKLDESKDDDETIRFSPRDAKQTILVTSALEFALNVALDDDPDLQNLSFFQQTLPSVWDTNIAFIFIKPHANNLNVNKFVKTKLKRSGFSIISQGVAFGEDIARRKIVDRQYAAIASFATKRAASGIQLTDDKKSAFAMRFNIRWEEALEQGKIVNASRATEVLNITGLQLEALWNDHSKRPGAMQRLAPNVFLCHFAEQDLFVINGFYCALKEKLGAADASVTYYVVSWPESLCSWKHFRENILGSTDPAHAPDGSIRGKMFKYWQQMGLSEPPTTQNNGVHGSASPLEALRERYIWQEVDSNRNDIMGKRLKKFLEKDPFGQRLLGHDVPATLLEAWMENPFTRLKNFCGNLFEYVSQMNSGDFVQFCMKMVKKENA